MINSFKASGTTFNLEFDIELEKDKQVYCFIGENGVGKTKLLETMCNAVLYGHSLFKKESKLNKTIYSLEEINKKIHQLKIITPKVLEVNNIVIKDEVYDLEKIGNICFKKNPVLFYNPFSYVGAQNRGYGLKGNTEAIKLLGSKASEFRNNFLRTYNNLYNIEIDKNTVADWFITRILSNSSLVIKGSDAFKEVIFLSKILKDLEEDNLKDLIKTNKDSIKLLIYLNEGKLMFNNIPFQHLSTGYMAIMKIIQEIIDVYSSWNFENDEDMFNKKAIFFIDELEAHLHPKWENKFIPLLRKYFPKAIFYIATHSPLVISSVEDGEAYELIRKENKVSAKKLKNPKNWYWEDLFSQAFHVESNKEESFEETRDDFEKFADLVKLFRKNKDEATKKEAVLIYSNILENLADEDPRKITLESLYKLLG